MKKSNNKVSKSKVKRYAKNLKRKKAKGNVSYMEKYLKKAREAVMPEQMNNSLSQALGESVAMVDTMGTDDQLEFLEKKGLIV